ncbi:MAG: S8 family serine peptidase [Candidatus Sumerlaeia bacterium]|nr:S8 family serine peptidase [Candidatus Sumerlaeia bacterium]
MLKIIKQPVPVVVIAYLGLVTGCNHHLSIDPSMLPPRDVILEVEEAHHHDSFDDGALFRSVAKRGNHHYFEPLTAAAKAGVEAQPGVRVLPTTDPVIIHGNSLHPRLASAQMEPGRQLRVIQFKLPVLHEDMEWLRDQGAEVVHTLPGNAVVAWFSDLNTLGSFLALDDPRMTAHFPFPRPPLPPPTEAGEPHFLELQFYNDTRRVNEDISVLSTAGVDVLHGPRPTPDGDFHLASIRVEAANLDVLQRLETLVSIHATGHLSTLGETSGLIVANQTSWENGKEIPTTGVNYLDWLRIKLGLNPGEFPPDDAFPIVAVVDTGVGSGDPENPEAPYDPPADFLKGGDGPSRIVFNRRWQVPGIDGATDCSATTSNAGAVDTHGQVSASILAGYNNDTGPANADPEGFRYGMGVNPFGYIGSMLLPRAPFVDKSLIPTACLHDMVEDYWTALHDAGGTIPAAGGGNTAFSTNSWGVFFPEEARYIYDSYSQLFDYLVRDVGGGETPRHLTAVFAAGNSGNDGFNSIISPGLAKNVITVGGSECVDFRTDIPYCGSSTPYNPYGDHPFRIADNANDIWIYSSKGNDNLSARMKPDVVAPASLIYGNVTEVLGCPFPGENNDVPESVQPRLYARGLGTSFATPAVAASTQLTTYFLRELYNIDDPSPALIRAYTAHGAHFLTGADTGWEQEAGDPLPLPSPRQGFGRLNLEDLLNPIPRHFVNQEVILTPNPTDVYKVTGTVADASQPVRIVLTWTDPPSPTFGSFQGHIINDLDLQTLVRQPNQRPVMYYGNFFSKKKGKGGDSQPVGRRDLFRRDRSNNLEAIFIPKLEEGAELTITVSPYRIIRDAFFQGGIRPRQDFALVVSNFIADNP